MQKAGILHIQRGFTLVEMMVTIAVLVILASLAVPGLQAFTTRSGMNAIRDDFSIALQRARLDAISRNTCVSICQLAEGKTDACVTTAQEGWQGGWLVYVNAACSSTLPTAALSNAEIISVRQAGDARFQLIEKDPEGHVTFDARGAQIGQWFSGYTKDAQYTAVDANPLARAIVVNAQGRVSVAKYEPAKSTGGAQ